MTEVSYPPFSTSKISLQPEANSKSLLKLSKNEVVEGKVLRLFSSGNVSLLIKGRGVMARSYVPLKEGNILSLKVEETEPIPTLKLLGIKFTDSNAINTSSILLSAIKENLWRSTFENINHHGLPKEALSPFKELTHDLSMGLFSRSTPKLLWEIIDKSGLNWEAKLRKIFLGKKIGGAANLDKLMQGDLKGLTSRLVALKEEDGVFLKRFVSAIKNIQLLNHLGLEQDRKIFIPIPIQFPDGLFTLGQLLIHLGQKEKDGNTRKKSDKNPFRIMFLLELSNLGPLRADLSIKGKEIGGRFLITKEEIKFFIKNNIPSLIKKLKDKGFTVSSIECHLKDPEAVKQSLVEEIIHQEGNTISLVA
ncbi:MAG: flagellar hook-length control protein FliK [Deltaproteobacteria bacterium]|nr:flagellar hook-length control protein FliK [Deltaproteobacteria bacterium]